MVFVSMRKLVPMKPEVALRPKYTARGLTLYQLVRPLASRSEADMYKTYDPHLPLVSFQDIEKASFRIDRVLEDAQRKKGSMQSRRRT